MERENRQAISGLQIGMTVDGVRVAMPHPVDLSEAFAVDDLNYRVLFDRIRHVTGDGETTRDETTPLVIANDELIGWGASAWFDLTGRPLTAGN
ncbi:MAG: DUF3192 domain-containing protein [Wenzhouxiangellaceae bacterium]|nr:DUF3192 domain-containing protein [Wenzhouxiangellaceae bacterium]